MTATVKQKGPKMDASAIRALTQTVAETTVDQAMKRLLGAVRVTAQRGLTEIRVNVDRISHLNANAVLDQLRRDGYTVVMETSEPGRMWFDISW